MVNVINSLRYPLEITHDEDTKDIYIIFCYWNPSVKTLRVTELNAAFFLFTTARNM